MDRYAARICWNTNGWVAPSGDAPRLEKGTWVAKTGYGHEEWLFNFQWLIEGWKYGYVRPVRGSWGRGVSAGEKIDLRLYTIGDGQSWFYVGRIAPCHILTDEDAEKATATFRRQGWIRQMKEQAKAVGGDTRQLDAQWFCMKFRPSDAEILDPLQQPVGRTDAIRRVRRYSLVMLEGKLKKAIEQWPTREGTRESTGSARSTKRGAIAATSIELAHGHLQHDLYTLLAKRYGKAAVIKEENFADIKVKLDAGTTLVEVKTDARPMFAVREAVGQLLEYAFACERRGERVTKLVVAAPGEPDERLREYVEHLRGRGLQLDYICFRQGMKDVEI